MKIWCQCERTSLLLLNVVLSYKLSLSLSVNTHKHVATFVAHSLSLNLSLVCGDVAVAAALLLQKNFYNKNLYS